MTVRALFHDILASLSEYLRSNSLKKVRRRLHASALFFLTQECS